VLRRGDVSLDDAFGLTELRELPFSPEPLLSGGKSGETICLWNHHQLELSFSPEALRLFLKKPIETVCL
jgi:hypothetical protein